MTIWNDLWLIRIVRLVENVIEWRKQVAGKVAESCAGFRIGYGLGSDWRPGQGTRPELESGTKRLGKKEGHVG